MSEGVENFGGRFACVRSWVCFSISSNFLVICALIYTSFLKFVRNLTRASYYLQAYFLVERSLVFHTKMLPFKAANCDTVYSRSNGYDILVTTLFSGQPSIHEKNMMQD